MFSFPMRNTPFAILALIILTSACARKDGTQDKARLDSLISHTPPLSIQTRRFEGTNEVSHLMDAESAKTILSALSETNRLPAEVLGKKRISAWIEFSNGTNFISRLAIFDDGIFHFDDYDFRLKSPLPIEESGRSSVK